MAEPALKIRAMSASDKEALMRLLSATPEFKPAEVIVAEEVVDAYLLQSVSSGYHTYIAEFNGSLAGYVCYGPTPLTEGTWDIYWIAVDRKLQDQGIGRYLMEFAETDIRRSFARIALLETSSKPDYVKTVRFYEKLGYAIICRIPDFYAPGDDKIILQKKF